MIVWHKVEVSVQ